LTDLGFGVSQVLPVLVGGLTLAPDGLFIVDLLLTSKLDDGVASGLDDGHQEPNSQSGSGMAID